MKKIIWFLIAGLLVSTASMAQEDRKIEQAIKHRKAAFTLMSTYWSRILQTVDGDRPYDANAVIIDAKKVEYLSHLPWEGFVAGSERDMTTNGKEELVYYYKTNEQGQKLVLDKYVKRLIFIRPDKFYKRSIKQIKIDGVTVDVTSDPFSRYPEQTAIIFDNKDEVLKKLF